MNNNKNMLCDKHNVPLIYTAVACGVIRYGAWAIGAHFNGSNNQRNEYLLYFSISLLAGIAAFTHNTINCTEEVIKPSTQEEHCASISTMMTIVTGGFLHTLSECLRGRTEGTFMPLLLSGSFMVGYIRHCLLTGDEQSTEFENHPFRNQL